MSDDRSFDFPLSGDGKPLAFGTPVKPKRRMYEFDRGVVGGVVLVGDEVDVYVRDIEGGVVDEMFCKPKHLVVDFVTVHGLLRDYVAANAENDVKTMREIALKLEVRKGVI